MRHVLPEIGNVEPVLLCRSRLREFQSCGCLAAILDLLSTLLLHVRAVAPALDAILLRLPPTIEGVLPHVVPALLVIASLLRHATSLLQRELLQVVAHLVQEARTLLRPGELGKAGKCCGVNLLGGSL